jgi:hypothetical protein|tara:strand:- start:2622 stop:3848 length:1227 start_codon:yes stop_codon:yes gene_type:complete
MNVVGFVPHRGQLKVINEWVKTDVKFCTLSTSRQWGKSLLGMNSLFYWLLNNQKSKGAWISPIYKQCRKVFEEMTNASHQLIKHSNKAELTIEFINGSTLQFLSADRGDSIRGFSFHYLVIDEAAFLKQDVFEQAILPTLAAIGRKCLIISTPKGKNWFYSYYLKGSDGGSDYYSVRGYTQDNPYIDRSFIREMKKSLPPNIFAQEFEAEFNDDGNDVFSNLSNICILNEWTAPRSTNQYYAGIDTAVSNDYSVIVIMDALGRVVKIDRTNNIPMETTAGIFNDLLRFYNCRNCNIEVNGVGIGMWEIMSKTNKQLTKWVTTNENKAIGIQQLIRACEETTLELPSEELMPEVINEFQAFTYKQLASGRLQFSAPSGYHDDIVMATMMANEARRSGHLKRNKLYIGQR